ncbi:uncharacterized protein EI97DRAFT_445739 [Westerdykella ornata]|uniref:Uncharacterized protein n=1 Tax=Westerdykella ornata TaxID=318751 RepID=A0A6A6J8G4_WESOR|nr:uncharacterized protein EI97DRAFT_445739 [Westerdykella ornata]KAF2272537.1 hypothetical protein EI97DRAFT_445739 [Westerdykella ornata]
MSDYLRKPEWIPVDDEHGDRMIVGFIEDRERITMKCYRRHDYSVSRFFYNDTTNVRGFGEFIKFHPAFEDLADKDRETRLARLKEAYFKFKPVSAQYYAPGTVPVMAPALDSERREGRLDSDSISTLESSSSSGETERKSSAFDKQTSLKDVNGGRKRLASTSPTRLDEESNSFNDRMTLSDGETCASRESMRSRTKKTRRNSTLAETPNLLPNHGALELGQRRLIDEHRTHERPLGEMGTMVRPVLLDDASETSNDRVARLEKELKKAMERIAMERIANRDADVARLENELKEEKRRNAELESDIFKKDLDVANLKKFSDEKMKILNENKQALPQQVIDRVESLDRLEKSSIREGGYREEGRRAQRAIRNSQVSLGVAGWRYKCEYARYKCVKG